MNKKAIAAGHVCIDITPVFPGDMAGSSNLGDILRPGKLIEMNAADVHTGGSVANTGLAMKILGADVKLLGKIGDDAFGRMIRGILDQHDAGDDLIEVSGETTSYSVVIAAPGVDRIFLHCPGANNTFTADDIPERALEGAALFHFGYPPIMRSMYKDGGKELVRLFREVKAHGIATSLDLAAVDPNGEAAKEDWAEILAGVLPYVDFFVPSFEELCFMLEPELYEEMQVRAGGGDVTELIDLGDETREAESAEENSGQAIGSSLPDRCGGRRFSVENVIRPLAGRCLDMGAKAVLLKCGAPGMFLMTSDRMEGVGERLELDAGCWNGFEKFEKSFKIDRVLSGTGAGDTSIAAFLTSVLNGAGPGEALENAAAEGALCCTAYDAVSGLLPLDEVRKMIEEGWEKR